MSWWKRIFRNRTAGMDEIDPYATHESDKKPVAEFRTGTAEFELFIAQSELDGGENLAHGAEHLANLLKLDPAHAPWLALAQQYAARAGADPVGTLLPEAEERYASTEALRAWLLQHEGRLEEAVELIVAVMQAAPDAKYLDAWVLGWVEAEGALESMSSTSQLRLAKALIEASSEARLTSARRLQAMQRWSQVLGRLTPPEDMQAAWRMLHIGLLRRAGRFDEALQVAGPLADAPDWHIATAIGLVLRQQRRMSEAEAAFRRAIAHDPNTLSTFLEAGDGWLESEDWQAALGWYEQVLAREAGHAWAQPSSWLCQWKLTQDQAWSDRLLEAAKAGNERARRLWVDAFAAVPEPQDASANVLRQVRDNLRSKPQPPAADQREPQKPNRISMAVSSLEAPSNALAFALEFAAAGTPTELEMKFENIPQPDPREPVEPVAYPLWRYTGTEGQAALPPPAPHVQERIAQLARAPYRPTANWAAASHVALALGPASGEDRSLDVLACMVHPPTLPSGTPALAWVPRVQLVAAQVLAQVDEGWEGSRRRELLLSVLFGPSDWATSAAIQALAWIGQDEPAHALDIHRCFERLEAHRPDSGYCCWLATLYDSWRHLPVLFEPEREALAVKLAELSSDEAEG